MFELNGEQLQGYLDSLEPIKLFTGDEILRTTRHISMVMRNITNAEDNARTICGLLGYLWYTEGDKQRRELLLEAAWMGMRMSQKLGKGKGRGKNQKPAHI